MYTIYLLILQLNYFKRYCLKCTLNTDLNANENNCIPIEITQFIMFTDWCVGIKCNVWPICILIFQVPPKNICLLIVLTGNFKHTTCILL